MTLEDSTTLQEVLSSSDKEEWSKAVNAELTALKQKQVWQKQVELPQDKRANYVKIGV